MEPMLLSFPSDKKRQGRIAVGYYITYTLVGCKNIYAKFEFIFYVNLGDTAEVAECVGLFSD
jgi:hypothetical protein